MEPTWKMFTTFLLSVSLGKAVWPVSADWHTESMSECGLNGQNSLLLSNEEEDRIIHLFFLLQICVSVIHACITAIMNSLDAKYPQASILHFPVVYSSCPPVCKGIYNGVKLIKTGSGWVMKETDFGLFLRACWGSGGAWRIGDCGGEESTPCRVGGRGRSMSDGRLRTSFSFLVGLWEWVDFFGLMVQNTGVLEIKKWHLLKSKNLMAYYILRQAFSSSLFKEIISIWRNQGTQGKGLRRVWAK